MIALTPVQVSHVGVSFVYPNNPNLSSASGLFTPYRFGGSSVMNSAGGNGLSAVMPAAMSGGLSGTRPMIAHLAMEVSFANVFDGLGHDFLSPMRILNTAQQFANTIPSGVRTVFSQQDSASKILNNTNSSLQRILDPNFGLSPAFSLFQGSLSAFPGAPSIPDLSGNPDPLRILSSVPFLMDQLTPPIATRQPYPFGYATPGIDFLPLQLYPAQAYPVLPLPAPTIPMSPMPDTMLPPGSYSFAKTIHLQFYPARAYLPPPLPAPTIPMSPTPDATLPPASYIPINPASLQVYPAVVSPPAVSADYT